MSIFNPTAQVQDVNPDWSRSSRGQEPNRAFADLFSNVADLSVAGVKAGDQVIQAGIKKDVYGAYDKTNDQFGIPAATNVSQDAMNDKGPAVAPQMLQDSLGQLSLLQKAYSQNKLPAYAYWGRLENEVKSLREKFPGYREVIDNTVSSITGATPANAIRETLMSEWAKNAAQGAQFTNKIDSQIIDNPGKVAPANLSRFMQNPTEENRQAAYKDLADYDAHDAGAKADLQGIAVKLAKNQDVGRDALTFGQKNMDQMGNTMLYDTTKLIGKDFNTAMTSIDDAMKDGKIDDKEMGTVLPLVNQLKTHYAQGINDLWSRPRDEFNGKSLNEVTANQASDRSTMIKASTDQFNQMWDEALNGNAGILKFNMAKMDAIKNGDAIDLLSSSNSARQVQVLSTIGGPNWFGELLKSGQGGTVASSLVTAVAGKNYLDTATAPTGEVPSVDSQIKDIEKNVPKDQQGDASNAVIQNNLKTLLDPTAPIQQAKKVAESMFSEGNTGFLTNFTNGDHNSNWIRLFTQMTTPEMTRRMKAIGNEEPALWDNYKKWTFDQWSGLFGPQAQDIQETGKSNPEINFTYNPDANEINVAVDYSKSTDTFYSGQAANTAQEAVSDINTYLHLIDPIMKESKMDPAATVQGLLQGIGIKNVQFPATGTKENRQKDDQQQSKADTSPNTDVALIDMIGKAEGADYNTFSGGSNQDLTTKTVSEVQDLQKNYSTVPGAVSSAAGKPQIIASTMKWLVDNGILDPGEKFDKEAQDRATLALLNRRGYGQYKSGKLPAKDFLDRLSQEWASIPNSSGVSSYLGIAGNDKTKGGEVIASLINGS